MPPWVSLAGLSAGLCEELGEKTTEAFNVSLRDEPSHVGITVCLPSLCMPWDIKCYYKA